MRTTIEIRDEQRARLLELAAKRGDKGFSKLVQEALDRFLEDIAAEDQKIERAVAVLGTLDEETERRLKETVEELRESWR
jgi:hypothetical protein